MQYLRAEIDAELQVVAMQSHAMADVMYMAILPGMWPRWQFCTKNVGQDQYW